MALTVPQASAGPDAEARRAQLLRLADPLRPPRIAWEGSQFVVHSMGQTNRELCLQLLAAGAELTLLPYEPDEFAPALEPRLLALAARQRAPLSGPVDVVVRHRWPPDWSRPAAGRLVLFQPWEFGAVPTQWLDAIGQSVDEVWVPTRYVRNGYLRSGAPPERVHVVPNGVDTAVFHPGATPLPLRTRKRFRFLFVGGTIPRKGIDLLLAAWLRAFTARDDVCLVVKDMGKAGMYRGKTAQELIARVQGTAGTAEIEYLDQSLSTAQMAGLYTACQALVHPYRGEGFGMPIAEAMACGLPAVVTGHGAALDFCDQTTGWLIPAREVTVPRRTIDQWTLPMDPWIAAPDLDALVALLREVVANREQAAQRGATAMARIAGAFTWRHAAEQALLRVAALRGV